MSRVNPVSPVTAPLASIRGQTTLRTQTRPPVAFTMRCSHWQASLCANARRKKSWTHSTSSGATAFHQFSGAWPSSA